MMSLAKLKLVLIAVIAIPIVWLVWLVVSWVALVMITGLSQCDFDGCGPSAPWWEDMLFLLVLIVPPLFMTGFIANMVAKKFGEV